MIKNYIKKNIDIKTKLITHFFLSKFKILILVLWVIASIVFKAPDDDPTKLEIRKSCSSFLVKELNKINRLIEIMSRMNFKVIILKTEVSVSSVFYYYSKIFKPIEGLTSIWVRKHPQITGWSQVIIVCKSFFNKQNENWIIEEIESQNQKQNFIKFKYSLEKTNLFNILAYDLNIMGEFENDDEMDKLYMFIAEDPLSNFIASYLDGFNTHPNFEYENYTHPHHIFRSSLSFVEAFFVENSIKFYAQKAYIEQKGQILSIDALKEHIVDWACMTFPKQSKEFSRIELLDYIETNNNFLSSTLHYITKQECEELIKKINGN